MEWLIVVGMLVLAVMWFGAEDGPLVGAAYVFGMLALGAFVAAAFG